MQDNIAAMVADNQMRSRDERFAGQDKYQGKPDPLSQKKTTGQPKPIQKFRPKDFRFNEDNTATCPAGQLMSSAGTVHVTARGLPYQAYTAKAVDCNACALSEQCLRGPIKPNDERGRQVGTGEPAFANIRHNKRLTRLNHRSQVKVNTQWNLYCMVHNIEKLSQASLGQHRIQ